MGKICHRGKCKGRSQGDSCGNSGDCDAGLACVRNQRPPHDTTCKVPIQTGGFCTEDFECEMDNFCTPKEPNDWVRGIKRCTEMYLITDESAAGAFEWDLGSFQAAGSETLEDMLRNGR